MSTHYYAILDHRATIEEPAGLARRRHAGDGVYDESLTPQGDWEPTALIAAWDRAESSDDFVEVDEAEAARLAEHLLTRWSRA